MAHPSEKQLSLFVRVVLWFVVINSAGGAFYLVLFPATTEQWFFWKISPPINAALIGAMYMVAWIPVAVAAWRGTWESARYVVVMGFVLSVLLTTATFLHIDKFFGGPKLYYWLAVYLSFPVMIAILYYQYERGGSTLSVISQPITPLVRLVASVMGVGLALFVATGYLFPDALTAVWPWPLSPLMARVFTSWLSALATSQLWMLREQEWTRIQTAADLLISTPLMIGLIMFLHREDITGTGLNLGLFIAGLLMLGIVGMFMRWQQVRARSVQA